MKISNRTNNILFKIINCVFSSLFVKDSLFIKKTDKLPETPVDFSPVIRFAACSDIHISGENTDKGAENFANLLDDMYSISENSDSYKNFDGILIAGDFTNNGSENQYEKFVSVLSEHKKDDTPLIICIGNHEFIKYRDKDASVGIDKYKKYISENTDTHTVINGYHFIGVSYSKDGKTFNGKGEWLDSEITKAEKESNNPVFVFQHPHPKLTVFGSVCWGDSLIKNILKKHSRVIDFSGHSHYVPTDPRSIYQGKFTALGTGSLKELLGNNGYIDSDSKSYCESAACLVIEGDKDGNIRIRYYDCKNRMFYKNCEKYIANTINRKFFAYTWKNQKHFDTKPVFKSDNICFTKSNDNVLALSFSTAKGFYKAETYTVDIKNSNGKKVLSKIILSDCVCADSQTVNIKTDNLPSGEYIVKIKPRSPYAKTGKSIVKRLKL